jgi:hypothetical protein
MQSLEIISDEDYPVLKRFISKVDVFEVKDRLDRRNGRLITIYVIIFHESPPSLTFDSWFRTAVQSQVKGYLRSKFGLKQVDVKIDTDNSFDMIRNSPYVENISIEEATKRDLIEVGGPYYNYLNKFGLNYLVVEKGHILGPNIGLMSIMETLLDVIPYDEITDLFAGTGAITKVALDKGVKKSTCIDLDISAARRNLSEFANNVTFLQQDLLQIDFSNYAPLVIADPTFPVCPSFVRQILPKLSKLCQTLVVGHGHPEHLLWNKAVRNALGLNFSFTFPVSNLAIEATLCTNDSDIFSKISSDRRFAAMKSSTG